MKGTEGAIALALALATAVPAIAGQAQASFTVSAVVPVRVTLTALEQPAELAISAADLAARLQGRRGHLPCQLQRPAGLPSQPVATDRRDP